MTNNQIYKIQQLQKKYSNKVVLEIPELDFKSGQFVALLGKNGSGKSTLMRMLSQQELFDAGKIEFYGKSIQDSELEVNPKICFVTEDQGLPFNENLNFWVRLFKKSFSAFDENLCLSLFQAFEINPEDTLSSMSRGQKMKALFSLGACRKPDVYLIDEITSVLDAGSRWVLMDYLSKESKRGCLIVMSTNISTELDSYANEVCILEKSKLVFSSPVADFKKYFRKIRVPQGHEDKILTKLKSKKIQFNKDNMWTILCEQNQNFAEFTDIINDQREISVSDLQTYYTTSGNLL